MDRRTLLRRMALLGAGSFLSAPGLLGETRTFHLMKMLDTVGIQLFSLPKTLDADFGAGMELLAQMGYREVELFGPYSFSEEEAKKQWAVISGMLGFSGSGYFGHTGPELKAILTANGLSVPSLHTDLATLRQGMGRLAKACHFLGATYVVLPAIPDEERQSLDDYRRLADDFNAIGEQARAEGIRFGYHNHGYGLQEVDGQTPLYLLLDHTDPELVFLEMDIFWTVAGGVEPVALLEKYPGRYRLLHIKDMARQARFSGDGGDARQWMELFPLMRPAGSGVIDLEAILPAARKAGVEHFLVEHDLVANPEVALRESITYLG